MKISKVDKVIAIAVITEMAERKMLEEKQKTAPSEHLDMQMDM